LVLRDYQIKIIEEIKQSMREGHRAIILQSVTGSGKTAIAAEMIRLASLKKTRCWFICNRVELVLQTARALDKIGLSFGFIAAGFAQDKNCLIQICSIQTLYRRFSELPRPDLIFWDEGHSIQARTWATVYEYFHSAYHIIMSATPCRLDGQGFRLFATHMVNGPDVSWLIQNGFLCDYRAFAPREFDSSSLKVRMGDYVKSDIEEKMMDKSITGNAVAEYKTKCSGKRNLVFCASVEHSIFVRDFFISEGIYAEHIDGKTDRSDRKESLARFEAGSLKILTSVDLVTTGLDIPAIECITFLRPTQSTSLAIQMMGRGLRPHPGKDHIIYLDHVGLFKKHGLPDDHREWSLDGVKKKPKDDIGSVKVCPVCFAAMPSLAKTCKECGHSFIKEQTQNALPEFDATELKEIDKTQFRKTKIDVDRAKAKTKDELVALGISRGYSHPHRWAHHVMQSRQRKKLNK